MGNCRSLPKKNYTRFEDDSLVDTSLLEGQHEGVHAKQWQRPSHTRAQRFLTWRKQQRQLRERRRVDESGSFSVNLLTRQWHDELEGSDQDNEQQMHMQYSWYTESTKSDDQSEDGIIIPRVMEFEEEDLIPIDEQCEVSFENSIEL